MKIALLRELNLSSVRRTPAAVPKGVSEHDWSRSYRFKVCVRRLCFRFPGENEALQDNLSNRRYYASPMQSAELKTMMLSLVVMLMRKDNQQGGNQAGGTPAPSSL